MAVAATLTESLRAHRKEQINGETQLKSPGRGGGGELQENSVLCHGWGGKGSRKREWWN